MNPLLRWGLLAALAGAAWRRWPRAGEAGPAADGAHPTAEEIDRAELGAAFGFLEKTFEEDKARIARELHDDLGGVLTVAKMHCVWVKAELASRQPDLAERAERIAGAIDEAVAIERRVVEALRPSLLDHLGLAAALDWYVKGTCTKARLDCEIDMRLGSEAIARDTALLVYRLVQDGLANVLEHARSSRFSLALERGADGYRLAMTHGDTGDAAAHRLVVMRQRVAALGGRLEVSDNDVDGHRVSVVLPFAHAIPHPGPAPHPAP